MKRRVALAKAQKDTRLAVELLNAYLEVFMGDTEAWTELSNLYVTAGQLSAAAFCLEECLLQHPENYVYYLRYADVSYAQAVLPQLLKYSTCLGPVRYGHARELGCCEKVLCTGGSYCAASRARPFCLDPDMPALPFSSTGR